MGREFFFTRFTSEVEVVFNARTITAYLDATILTKDSVIAEVGVADEEDLLPSVPEPKKRKMFQCPSCKPSRSFSDSSERRNLLSTWMFPTSSTN